LGPLSIDYTISAGPVPAGTWVVDPRTGGGRIIGEACHFIDLCTHIVGRLPSSIYSQLLSRDPDVDDSTVAVLGYPDGSSATIRYLARASRDLPKERFEVSGDEITASCDNFRQTRIHGACKPKRLRGINQNKGQEAAIAAFLQSVHTGGPSPIPLAEIVSTSLACFAIATGSSGAKSVRLDAEALV
jgi:predicted dehydrogenase